MHQETQMTVHMCVESFHEVHFEKLPLIVKKKIFASILLKLEKESCPH